MFAVEQYRFSNVFLFAIPLYVMAVMSTMKHTLDISLQTALIGAVIFGVVQYLFMNFTWAGSLIMPKKKADRGLYWLVTLGHAFILALACAIQVTVIYTLSFVLPTPVNMARNAVIVLLSLLVGMNIAYSLFCWNRSASGLMLCLRFMMLILASFVFVLGFGVYSNYFEVRAAPQILPTAGAQTAASLVKRFWLYGLHVKLPADEMLSYTKWDS